MNGERFVRMYTALPFFGGGENEIFENRYAVDGSSYSYLRQPLILHSREDAKKVVNDMLLIYHFAVEIVQLEFEKNEKLITLSRDYKLLTRNHRATSKMLRIEEEKRRIIDNIRAKFAIIGSVLAISAGTGVVKYMADKLPDDHAVALHLMIDRAMVTRSENMANRIVIDTAIMGLPGGLLGYIMGTVAGKIMAIRRMRADKRKYIEDL